MIYTLQYLGYVLDRDFVLHQDGVRWLIGNPPSGAEIDAAALSARKAARTSEINREATARITGKYPLEKQSSANLGVYPQAFRDTMASEIASVISASNAACDLVDAATTVAEVDSVTVNWPVI